MKLNSRSDVRSWLRIHGLTVSQWAREKGFPLDTVYAVLSGRAAGHWGQAHEVAVALGLKQSANEVSIPRPLDRIRNPAFGEPDDSLGRGNPLQEVDMKHPP